MVRGEVSDYCYVPVVSHWINSKTHVGDHVDRVDVDTTTTLVGASEKLCLGEDTLLRVPTGKENVTETCKTTIGTIWHIKDVTTTSTMNLADITIHTVENEPNHLKGKTPGIGMIPDIPCHC